MSNVELLGELLQNNTILAVSRCYITTAYHITLFTLKFLYENNQTGELKSFCLINDEIGNVNIYNKMTIIDGVDYWDEFIQLVDDVYQYCKVNNKTAEDFELHDRGNYVIIKQLDSNSCWNIMKTNMHDSIIKQISSDDGVKKLLSDIYRGAR